MDHSPGDQLPAALARSLPEVECPPGDPLREAVEWFITAAELGRVGQAGGPLDLVVKVLPFLEDDPGREYAAWLPLKRVLGHSWRWTTPIPRPGREDLGSYLRSPERADPRDGDVAQAWWIPELGLGVMHEGKNRVRYLREVCGAADMPSRVTLMRLPEASRLRVLTADIGAGRFHALVLDEQWLTVLTHPDLTLPLLRGYGVHPQEWPGRVPRLDELMGASGWQSHGAWRNRAIDVQQWKLQQRERAAIISGSPADLAGIAPNWPGIQRLGLFALAAAAVAGVAAVLQPLDALGVAVLAGLAFATGALTAAVTRVIQGPRKLWPPNHAPNTPAEPQR